MAARITDVQWDQVASMMARGVSQARTASNLGIAATTIQRRRDRDPDFKARCRPVRVTRATAKPKRRAPVAVQAGHSDKPRPAFPVLDRDDEEDAEARRTARFARDKTGRFKKPRGPNRVLPAIGLGGPGSFGAFDVGSSMTFQRTTPPEDWLDAKDAQREARRNAPPPIAVRMPTGETLYRDDPDDVVKLQAYGGEVVA